MGLTRDAAAEMSTELVTLAADLGSFNNQFKAKVPRHGVVFVRMFPVDDL